MHTGYVNVNLRHKYTACTAQSTMGFAELGQICNRCNHWITSSRVPPYRLPYCTHQISFLHFITYSSTTYLTCEISKIQI